MPSQEYVRCPVEGCRHRADRFADVVSHVLETHTACRSHKGGYICPLGDCGGSYARREDMREHIAEAVLELWYDDCVRIPDALWRANPPFMPPPPTLQESQPKPAPKRTADTTTEHLVRTAPSDILLQELEEHLLKLRLS